MYQAVPPVEADVSAEVGGEIPNSDLIESALARHINDAWSRAKFAKMPITDRLLRCERQRRGEYDPDKANEIASTGGSDIYMMLTDIKCRAAKSWIKDVSTTNGDRQYALDPAENPKLPPEVAASIADLVRAEAEEFLAQGAMIHPEAFRVRSQEVHDEIIVKMREEAKSAAYRHEGVIEDQLSQGGWPKAYDEFLDDFVTYPTSIIKGPTVRKKKRLEWGPDYTPIVVNDFSRETERVSPFDIFPSPNSTGPNDGYLIQRHRLRRSSLSNLIGVPGYSDENIQRALDHYGERGLRYYEYGDQQRDDLEGKPHSRLYRDNTIEALEFWGPASGQTLMEWGMTGLDPYKEYEINAWIVGSYVIKAVVNPDPLGHRPYDIAQWESIPGSFWGVALPEIMRDVQVMCNAAARSLANNMGLASGPMAEVVVDRLADGEQVTTMHPWRIFQVTSDRTGGGQPAIKFFQPNMNAESLMNVYMTFMRQADEITGIPNYVYGSSAVAGAGRTASGLSMLMDNASKGIKQAIAACDQAVIGVVTRLYIHNMMYHPDPYIKGDFKVVAKGTLGLVMREQLQIRRNEFLAATANPVDLQIIGAEGRAYLLRENAKALQMDTDKIVPSPEELKFKMAKQQEQQMAQMAMQGGQPPAPTTTDAAGNPAGGTDANIVQ